MLTEISEIVNRSRATLIEDAAGVLSLFVMLYAGLTLSGSVPADTGAARVANCSSSKTSCALSTSLAPCLISA